MAKTKKTKKFNPLEECIIRGTKDIVNIAERAKSVELTFKFDKNSVPTVSYKVDELPLVVEESSDGISPWNDHLTLVKRTKAQGVTKMKIKSCPNCNKSGKAMIINRIWFSGSIFDKRLYFVECPSCHWCGKTKLFRWRAIFSWNRRKR